MLAMGSVGQMKLPGAKRVEMKHLERSAVQFPIFCPLSPTPLRSHAFVAMQSIMLAMGSVGQVKLACAINI